MDTPTQSIQRSGAKCSSDLFSDPPSFREILSIHYKYVAIAVLDSVKGTTSTTPQEQAYRSFQIIHSLCRYVLLSSSEHSDTHAAGVLEACSGECRCLVHVHVCVLYAG